MGKSGSFDDSYTVSFHRISTFEKSSRRLLEVLPSSARRPVDMESVMYSSFANLHGFES